MAMKTTIDDPLTRLAHGTHSPRGQYAATEQNYQSLLDRIPSAQRPALGQKTHKKSAALVRRSAAACLWLMVGIGLTMAGVWYHQHYHTPSATESLTESEQSDVDAGPRTLIYQATPLADITVELSEVFHTHIHIGNPELGNYCVTAAFSTDESLDEILSILAEIGNFEVRKTAEGFILE